MVVVEGAFACVAKVPSLRACTPRKTITPTVPAVISKATAATRNASPVLNALNRVRNADRALKPRGTSCTRSQISGGSFKVLTTAVLATARITGPEETGAGVGTAVTGAAVGTALIGAGTGFATGSCILRGGAGFSS